MFGQDPFSPTDARTRAHLKAVHAALTTLGEDPGNAVMFNEKGQLGLVISAEFPIMELSPYLDVRRVANKHIVTDQEVIAAVLATGAIAYRFIHATTAQLEEQGIADESLPEGSEGADVLPVPQPDVGRILLVGERSGQGEPRGKNSECEVLAFERR